MRVKSVRRQSVRVCVCVSVWVCVWVYVMRRVSKRYQIVELYLD
jgi:hypothetical protein